MDSRDVEDLLGLCCVQPLVQDPMTPNNNVTRLSGAMAYRQRVGDWRVIYTLKHQTLTVIVVKVGHRREGYS